MPTPLAVRKGLPACMAHSACLVHRHPGSALAAAREFAFCICIFFLCVCVCAPRAVLKRVSWAEGMALKTRVQVGLWVPTPLAVRKGACSPGVPSPAPGALLAWLTVSA